MKLIDKVFKRFGYEKASRLAELVEAIGMRYYPSYGENTPENFSKNITAYRNEVWVYACVYVIANTIAGLPWHLYKWKMKKGKFEKDIVSNDQIETLLEKPNYKDPNSTFYSLIEWTVANLELIGNAYWLNNELYGNPKKPKALINLLSSKIRVIKGAEAGMISGYKFITGTGNDLSYQPEVITHFRYMSPDNYFYGQSSFNPAIYSIDVIKEAQKTNLNMFKNGTMIDAYLETEQTLNQATYDRVKLQFKEKYMGSANAHKTPILEQGLKYNAITGNMKDLEYVNGIKLSREDICAVHGVPPLLVGILDQASYSNYETALKVFYYFTIIPKLHRLNEAITTIVQKFDSNLYFEFDTSNEEVLKENEEQKAKTAQIYFNMGVPFNKINQRLNLGFEDVEGGDIGYLPFSLQPANMVQTNSEPAPASANPAPGSEDEGEDGGKSKSLKRLTYNKEKKEAIWKQFDRTTRMIERRYMSIIGTYFAGLQMGILHRLSGKKSIEKGINVETLLFDEGDEINRWSKQSKKVHELSMKTNANRELVNLGLGEVFNISNPRVQAFLKVYGLKKAKEVIGNAREAVKKTLIQGVEAGEGIPELKKRIQATFTAYTDQGYKAERIARTEVIGTSNRGALEAYKQAKVEKKAWLAQPDARDTHIQAGQQYSEKNAIPVDEDFEVGGGQGECPGNIGLAEEDINCRCSIIPVIED